VRRHDWEEYIALAVAIGHVGRCGKLRNESGCFMMGGKPSEELERRLQNVIGHFELMESQKDSHPKQGGR
jgi:hypothetical protein